MYWLPSTPDNVSLLGRTTFVNTLCGKKVLEGKDADDAENAHLEEGVKIKPITVGTCFTSISIPANGSLMFFQNSSSTKKAPASLSQLSIPLASVTRSITRQGTLEALPHGIAMALI